MLPSRRCRGRLGSMRQARLNVKCRNTVAQHPLKQALLNMRERSESDALQYYFLTLTANQEGFPSYEIHTSWVGFHDEEGRVELREASIVKASRILKLLREDLKEGCLVVESGEELRIFLLIGGHAIIEQRLAQQHLADILAPQPVVRTGFTGFRSTKDLPRTTLQRAPTKKQRMRIIQRDRYRCRICGRSPRNNVDITLHIHHIRPWAQLGVTDDDNLITLCHTCHEGLDPHCDLNLFGLLSESGEIIDIDNSREKYFESLRRYREESFRRARKERT
jgi:hypothetical protein